MAPALGAEIFSRGFRFLPTPQEAVTYYLPRFVGGKPLHDAVRPVVHHADVYACAPGDLARHFRPLPRTGDRFFFTPGAGRKRARAGATEAKAGSWHAQSTVDIRGRGDAKVGELKKLRYKKSGEYTDWLMDEYSSCCCSDQEGDGESQFVLCRMYVSPRAALTSAARQESAAFFPLPPLPAQAAAPKRPAPSQPAMLPCAKRMRGPVLQLAGGNTSLPPPQLPVPPVPTRYVRKMPFAPPQPSCAPRRGATTLPVTQPSPASALPPAPPAPIVRKMCFTPPQCRGSTPPPVTQPSPGLAPPLAPPAPVPSRPAVQPRGLPMPPLPTPPQPLSQPKQRLPWSTPPVVHACHMPRQVPFQPQVPVLAKQRRCVVNPFEAAMLRDEAEEQTVAAAPHPSESPAAAPGLQDDDDDLVKDMEDAMSTLEAEEQTVAASPLPPPSLEAPAAALQDEDGWDDFAKDIEDGMATAEAETAGGSTMTDDECDQLAAWLEDEMTTAVA